MRRPIHRLIMGMGLLAFAVAGCERHDEELVTVRGTIRYQGQLLTDGAIVFAPDADRGNYSEMAVGEIKPDGSFQLQTDAGSNLGPGWYRISVVTGGRSAVKLPDHYRDPLRSGLEREVRAGRENTHDFDLN